ncbi:MAG: 50S ribosomal protein L28 [Abditibacteriota bacterium]|nr:50S ribosomal protein L28 [Abditibacteriota bacterium]MBR4748102.1 50S ribosomal protein L28 [Abditibacteriota bacterium]
MSRVCSICGKGPQFGHNIRHIHSGQWARRAPKTNKVWYPNLQTVRAVVGGETKRIKVCTDCLKKGLVIKPIKQVKISDAE